MQRGWVKLMHAPACISVLHCDVLQEWWDEQTNEAGIPSVGNTQAMQEQRRHRQQHYTASLTRTPTCPNPTRLIQACHTAAKNTATHSTVCRYNCLTRYISNNLLSLTCTHTDRQYFSCAKRMNCFGLESQDNHSSQVSISWLSELSWHKSKEGLQDKLWIRARVLMNVPALPFLSSCVPSAPSSTLPPASLNTHTHNGLHGYQGDGNVTLNCCHLCWASINKSMNKIVIKNTWIAACTDWERWTDWSRENRARWKKKL